jgi:hypothetical protein
MLVCACRHEESYALWYWEEVSYSIEKGSHPWWVGVWLSIYMWGYSLWLNCQGNALWVWCHIFHCNPIQTMVIKETTVFVPYVTDTQGYDSNHSFHDSLVLLELRWQLPSKCWWSSLCNFLHLHAFSLLQSVPEVPTAAVCITSKKL